MDKNENQFKYPDGSPMPKEHKEWFDSGPITPDMLHSALEILRRGGDK